MGLLKKLGLLGTTLGLGLTSCVGNANTPSASGFLNPDTISIANYARSNKQPTSLPTIKGNMPALTRSTENKGYPFPTHQEILERKPSNYFTDPATVGKNPLEDRLLRPLKAYDTVSALAIDGLFGERERYFKMMRPSRERDFIYQEEGHPSHEEQTVMLRELAKWAFDLYKQTDGPFAGSLRSVDGVVRELTTFGSIKLDPKIGLSGSKMEKWGLGLRTRIGEGKLSLRYEHGSDHENGRKDATYLLEYSIDF